jgi:16S rRNA G527 N7-methylase RsmG
MGLSMLSLRAEYTTIVSAWALAVNRAKTQVGKHRARRRGAEIFTARAFYRLSNKVSIFNRFKKGNTIFINQECGGR